VGPGAWVWAAGVPVALPDWPFPRCHAFAAMATLPPADELTAPRTTRAYYPEMLAAAMATFQAGLFSSFASLLIVVSGGQPGW